jgi:hypothetical protein
MLLPDIILYLTLEAKFYLTFIFWHLILGHTT